MGQALNIEYRIIGRAFGTGFGRFGKGPTVPAMIPETPHECGRLKSAAEKQNLQSKRIQHTPY